MNLAALQRRLDALALDQLRAVAAEQLATIEQQRERIARLEASERDAWLIADGWREDALDALTQLAEETGQRVGLTPCGQVLVIPDQRVLA